MPNISEKGHNLLIFLSSRKICNQKAAGKGFQAGLSFVYNLSNSRRKFLWLRTLRNWGTERVPKDLRAGRLRTMPAGSPHFGRVLTRRVGKRRMRAIRGSTFSADIIAAAERWGESAAKNEE